MYIYIYIERERDVCVCVYMCVCIYIYIYIHTLQRRSPALAVLHMLPNVLLDAPATECTTKCIYTSGG